MLEYMRTCQDSPLRKRCIKNLRHGFSDFGLRKLPMGPWELSLACTTVPWYDYEEDA